MARRDADGRIDFVLQFERGPWGSFGGWVKQRTAPAFGERAHCGTRIGFVRYWRRDGDRRLALFCRIRIRSVGFVWWRAKGRTNGAFSERAGFAQRVPASVAQSRHDADGRIGFVLQNWSGLPDSGRRTARSFRAAAWFVERAAGSFDWLCSAGFNCAQWIRSPFFRPFRPRRARVSVSLLARVRRLAGIFEWALMKGKELLEDPGGEWREAGYFERPDRSTQCRTIVAESRASPGSRRSSTAHRIFRLQLGYSAVVPGRFCCSRSFVISS